MPMRGLIGKFFHTFNSRAIQWQGSISEKLDEGYYLIQLYEWLTGGHSCQMVIHISEMKGWEFYDDEEFWKMEGERKSKYWNEKDGDKPEKEKSN